MNFSLHLHHLMLCYVVNGINGRQLSQLKGGHVKRSMEDDEALDVDESSLAGRKSKRKRWRNSRLTGYVTPGYMVGGKLGLVREKEVSYIGWLLIGQRGDSIKKRGCSYKS